MMVIAIIARALNLPDVAPESAQAVMPHQWSEAQSATKRYVEAARKLHE